MDKRDFKKEDRAFYAGKPGHWERLTLPGMTFLAIAGQGDPDGPAYAAALGALYPLAYGIKSACKSDGADFVVPPLETLWWADDPRAFVAGERRAWRWRAMIRVPDNVTPEALETARAAARRKGREGPLGSVTHTRFAEGDCLQTLHVGPYRDEAPLLACLHDEIMPAEGLGFAGPHHEIYLSNPRKARAEKLRTILRQPVRSLGPSA